MRTSETVNTGLDQRIDNPVSQSVEIPADFPGEEKLAGPGNGGRTEIS